MLFDLFFFPDLCGELVDFLLLRP